MVTKPLTIVLLLFVCASHGLHAQWTQANGPFGGTITSFAELDDVLLASVESAGFYRSTNNGEQWLELREHAPIGTPGSIFSIRSDLFACTSRGLWLSADKGLTWQLRADSVTFNALIAKGRELYGARDGVYWSGDLGLTWSKVLSTKLRSGIGCLVEIHGRIIAADVDSVYLSDNDGATWSAKSTDLMRRVSKLTVAGDKVFADCAGGLFVSNDYGSSWVRQTGGGTHLLHAYGTELYTVNYNKIYYSSDTGTTWQVRTELSSVPLIVQRLGSILFVGTSRQSVLRSSNNGIDWTDASNGIRGVSISSTAFDSRYIYASSIYTGLHRSADAGRTWESCNSAWSSDAVYCLATSSLGLFAGAGKDVWHSTDYGSTWSDFDLFFSSDAHAYRLHADDTSYHVLSSYAVHGHATKDGGKKWRELYGRTVAPLGTDGYELGMALSVDGNTRGAVWDGALYISTDLGTSWQPNLQQPPNGSLPPYMMAYAASGSNMYAADFSSIYRSSDSGLTWSRLATEPQIWIQQIVAKDRHLYVGTSKGIIYSSDFGNTWSSIDEGFPSDKPVRIKSISLTPTHLIVGTESQGVWTRPLSEVVGVQDAAPSERLTSVQVFPNPSFESIRVTSSSYDLMHCELVSLTGDVLVSGQGEGALTLDVSALAAGAYVLRTAFGTHMISRMVVVR